MSEAKPTNKWVSIQSLLAEEEDKQNKSRLHNLPASNEKIETAVQPKIDNIETNSSLVENTSLTSNTRLVGNTSLVSEQQDAYRDTRLVFPTSLTFNTSPVGNTSQNNNLWASIPPVKGHIKFFHQITDHLYRYLDPYEQAVYTQLFRLSWGHNKPLCHIGLPKLAERANISVTAAQQAIKRLIQKGLVEKSGWNIGKGKEQGTEYKVPIPTSLMADTSLTGNTSLVLDTTNKDHDHDFKKKDHHQKVMTTYQSLTGNTWTKADETAYEKIKSTPMEQIEISIQTVIQRAPQKPATFAYFIKEILNPTQVNSMSRSVRKKQLERIMQQTRDNNRNRNGYPISEFAADVKDACAKEAISFDLDLFNEIVSEIVR